MSFCSFAKGMNVLLLVAFIVLLAVVGFVWAYNSSGTGGNPAVMGHSVDEMDWSKPLPNDLYVSGNVGIGTTSPGAKIEVQSSNLAGETSMSINNTASSLLGYISPLFKVHNDAYGAFPAVDAFIIGGTGNVGIGTTDPRAGLQINSWGHGIINTVSQANRTFDIMWYDFGDTVQASPLPPHSNYRWDLTYRGSDTTTVPNGQHEIFLQKGTAGGGPAVRAMTWWPNGNITGAFGNYHVSSDIRLKKDVVTITDALEKVLALRGVNFKWKDDSVDKELYMGMIAQEVEEIAPELVHTSDDEMKTKSVEYQYMVALLVEAIKEQQMEIENLKKLIEEK